ncbi:hypothetical protein QQ999_23765 [Pseudomonas fluorescens]
MIGKNESVKRLVVLFWVLISGFFLWLMSLADMQSSDERAYFRFVTFVFTSGFAFQVMYDLITSPISIVTKEYWLDIGKELLLASFWILLFIAIVNFEAHVKSFYLVPSLLSFSVVVFVVVGRSVKIHKMTREIKVVEARY